jgi:hypothetical protein
MTPIPAITIHQPWAQFIALGAKKYETRSWHTPLRGVIAIHAGKNTDELDDIDDNISIARSMSEAARAHYFATNGRGRFLMALRSTFLDAGFKKSLDLPLGAVLGIARLIACHSTTSMSLDNLSEREKLFGNFCPGRFAWELEMVQVFAAPIPARGGQRIWNWTPPVGIEVTQ